MLPRSPFLFCLQSVNITNLEPFTTYSIKLRYYNERGVGPWSQANATTMEGGKSFGPWSQANATTMEGGKSFGPWSMPQPWKEVRALDHGLKLMPQPWKEVRVLDHGLKLMPQPWKEVIYIYILAGLPGFARDSCNFSRQI